MRPVRPDRTGAARSRSAGAGAVGSRGLAGSANDVPRSPSADRAQRTMTLSEEQRAVHSMIREGRSFDEIEDYINALTLPGAHLGALWLLAWTEATDPQTRSRLVAETISALCDTSGGSASAHI